MPRTTLNLDDDVLAAIAQRRREHGSTLTDEVNAVLRTGLTTAAQPSTGAPRFQTTAFATGASRIGPLDDIDSVLRLADGERYR